ncbi:MAG: hypothetical protein U9N86_03290 [Bacteroidota bacterium]|nr:hypothetical protein [Bacteroidota bacterium]
MNPHNNPRRFIECPTCKGSRFDEDNCLCPECGGDGCILIRSVTTTATDKGLENMIDDLDIEKGLENMVDDVNKEIFVQEMGKWTKSYMQEMTKRYEQIKRDDELKKRGEE